jgi:hypothetical protein
MHLTQKPVPGLDLSPAEVLRFAALYVQRHGFHQGDMFASLTTPTPAACAQGAVKMVICGNPHAPYTLDDAALFDETLRVLAGHIDGEYLGWAIEPDGVPAEPHVLVAEWNDESGRTAEELVTALTGAAAEYDTREARLDAAYAAARPTTVGGAR